MHVSLVLVASIGIFADPQSAVDEKAQFLQQIREMRSKVQDFELLCEGEIVREERGANRPFESFQSLYAYRNDGSVYWDHYQKPVDSAKPWKRNTNAILSKDQLWHQVVRIPDRTGERAHTAKRAGGARSLVYEGSPGRFIFHYYWGNLINNEQKYDLTINGREVIDGRNCLRVEITPKPKPPLGGFTDRFWIDLDRDASVLKYELVVAKTTMLRVLGIELAQFELADGKRAWFPVRGLAETFPDEVSDPEKPHFTEMYRVVSGTLQFNKNWPDQRFDVAWKSSKPIALDSNSKIPRLGEPESRRRMGPAAKDSRASNATSEIERDLVRRLEEADRQARQLDASQNAQTPWAGPAAVQLVLVIGAMIGLVGAGILWRVRK
ncbi:MAG: hypothetical protein U0794_03705 [Isosphaeraceae bacterium]